MTAPPDDAPLTYDEARALLVADPAADARSLARRVVAAMTGDEKRWCLDGDQPCLAGLRQLERGSYHRNPFRAGRVDRIGLPGFAFADGPRGVVVDRATCFPVSMARGATWDPALEERVGEAIGRELRAIGADLYGGVCVNLLRHPAWGRAQETYGEDPTHVGEMGAALTRGVQRHAMACMKHFACNSMENARFEVDVTVDDATLHEVYLPHFRRIVDEGVAAVMSAYNQVNGAWCGEHPVLLSAILRDEWGFEGFVISDWIFGLRDAAASLAAGLDVEMPYRMLRAEHLEGALAAGQVSWADVDRAVERVVTTLLRFEPVLDRERTTASDDDRQRAVLASADHRALAREVAAASVVLLRNEPVDGRPVLPLPPDLASLAVLGELAAVVNLGDGGSSEVWPPAAVTILDGLRAALPTTDVRHDGGTDVEAAAATAAGAGAALVVVGYTYEDEGEFIGAAGTAHLASLFPAEDEPAVVADYEADLARRPRVAPPEHVRARSGSGGFQPGGDRTSLHLHPSQVALVEAVAAANPHTVVAIVAGSAVVISEWDAAVPAVVQCWYGGMEAGHGLADVLLGAVEPRGRLPFSVPAAEDHLPVFDRDARSVTYDGWHGWWHLERAGHQPAYPFGFGLGYTSFELADVTVVPEATAVRVACRVRNTGERDGSDVVQVYARRQGGDRPGRLVGFRRVEVPAGGETAVEWAVATTALAERDVAARAMVVRPGAYEVRVARHAADPGARHTVHLS